MRRILTHEELEKKQKIRNIIISIILLGIMLFSTIGFAFVYYESDSSTNGQTNSKVQNLGDRWTADYNGQQLMFSSSPESVNATKLFFLIDLSQYYGKTLYIDSESEPIYNEIAANIGPYTQRVQYACYDDCDNSPYVQKNCSDNLIVYRQKNENKVYQNNTCLFIEGDIRAVDAFLYRIFGLS